MDVLGSVSSIVAGKKHCDYIQKHSKAILIVINTCIIIAGGLIAFINKSWLDVLPIMGVLLHTSAFWISDERIIRRVSLLGSPFWFVYNFLSCAYGSAIGDILTICSIIVAMIKYRNQEKLDKIELGEV